MSKRFLSITLVAFALCFLASSCVKEKGFEERVTEIAKTNELSTRIATVGEQVKGMEKSITQLQSAQVALEQRADQIRIELAAAQGDIAALKSELDDISKTIESIQESIESLEAGIVELRQYVKDTISAVTNWVTATFATIEKTKEVDSILAARIDTVYLNYRKDISDSLKTAVAGIQTWVNGKLTGYWTIAQTQARLDSLGKIEKEDSATLAASITQAKSDLTAAYKTAIKASIDSLGGALNDTINNRILRANAVLDAKITAIDTRLTVLEMTVEKLVARIQSIEVVPEYLDGSVEIKEDTTVILRFEIHPASAADSIVKKMGKVAFNLQAVKTKAVTKASTFARLSIDSVAFSADDSLLVLTVSKGDLDTSFFNGFKPHNARLHISDGNTDRSSAYFPLTAYNPSYPGAPGLPSIRVKGTWWAPVNCGYDVLHPYGLLYQWGRKNGQCYDEKILPAKLEKIDSALVDHPDETDTNSNKFYWHVNPWYKGDYADTLWGDGFKGIYDPCPSGWRVPSMNEMGNLCFTDYDTTTHWGNSIRGQWDDTNNGWNFDGVFLPVAGSRSYEDGEAFSRGYFGFYWSSSVSSEEDAGYLTFPVLAIPIIDGGDRANGLSVRCIKDNSI